MITKGDVYQSFGKEDIRSTYVVMEITEDGVFYYRIDHRNGSIATNCALSIKSFEQLIKSKNVIGLYPLAKGE